MKRSLRHGRICILLTALACGSLDNINVSRSGTTTIEGAGTLSTLPSALAFSGFDNVHIGRDTTVENQSDVTDNLKSLKLRELVMVIETPETGEDFTFIRSVKFFASAEGLPKVLIAQGGPFTKGATSIGLDVEDVELLPYASAPTMQVTSEVTGKPPSDDTTIKATASFDADVSFSAVCSGGT